MWSTIGLCCKTQTDVFKYFFFANVLTVGNYLR
jgi:hypothetical protein